MNSVDSGSWLVNMCGDNIHDGTRGAFWAWYPSHDCTGPYEQYYMPFPSGGCFPGTGSSAGMSVGMMCNGEPQWSPGDDYDVRVYANSEVLSMSDNELHMYPLRGIEFHCTHYTNGQPDWVQGTYGQRGYFEGMAWAGVDQEHYAYGHTARVSFYENNLGQMKAATGAGDLYYEAFSDLIPSNRSTYWSAGESISTPGAFGPWGILADVTQETAMALDISEEDAAWSFCFWDLPMKGKGGNGWGDRSDLAFPEELIFGEANNVSTWATTAVGNTDTKGSWLGAYKYEYTNLGPKRAEKGTVEKGVYGLESIVAPISTSNLFVGNWLAQTGPYDNTWGTSLYNMVGQSPGWYWYFSDRPKGKHFDQMIFGWYCNVVGSKNRWNVGDCSPEMMSGPNLKTRGNEPNKVDAKDLLQHYLNPFPSSFEWHGPAPLYYFKEIYQQVFIRKA